MPTELDGLLAETDAAIAKLRDELRLEERLRERLVKRQAEQLVQAKKHFAPVIAAGGHRPAGTVVEGSLISRIIGILRTANRPMKASEIAAKVKEQGFTTTAKAGLNIAVSSQLTHGYKAGKFARVGHGKYASIPDPSEQ